MKTKSLIAALLLTFVVASVAYMAVNDSDRSRATIDGDGIFAKVPDVDPDVVVYYFYNDIRCTECMQLEGYARTALERHYAEELASGTIEWRMLSMDEPANEHYLIDYGLYSKSVVLARFLDGEEVRFKNLEEVWDLVYDEEKYIEYLRENIQEFLEAAS